MGIKDSLITMMGDFVQLNRNPEFRSKSDLRHTVDPTCESKRSQLAHRRHSLNITVGTDSANVRQRAVEISPTTQRHLDKINQRALKKQNELRQSNKNDNDNEDEVLNAEEEEDAMRNRGRRLSVPVELTLNWNNAIKQNKGEVLQKARQSSKGSESPPNETAAIKMKQRYRPGHGRSRSGCGERKHSDTSISRVPVAIEEEPHCDSVEKFSSVSPTKQFTIPEDWEEENIAAKNCNYRNEALTDNTELAKTTTAAPIPDVSPKIKPKQETDDNNNRKTSVASRKQSVDGLRKCNTLLTTYPKHTVLANVMRF